MLVAPAGNKCDHIGLVQRGRDVPASDRFSRIGAPVRIGLTYDLRKQYLSDGWSEAATSKLDSADSIDAIASAIAAAGHTVVHLGHARYLVDKLAAGERLDLVFNLCEGISGEARQAQIPALLDVYGIAYTFADPLTLSSCAHRGTAKAILRDSGVPTADSWTIQSLDDLRRVHGSFPLVAKPIARTTGHANPVSTRINDVAELSKTCCQLLAECARPVLVETYLPGREFTVGILGHGTAAEAQGTLEHPAVETNAHATTNRLAQTRACDARDPMIARIERTALAAWQALGGRDAGCVEMRLDADGAPQVIEVQALPSLHPERAALPKICQANGLTFNQLIESIVASACRRADQQANSQRAARPRRPHMMATSAESATSG